jgi:hypothetical protein
LLFSDSLGVHASGGKARPVAPPQQPVAPPAARRAASQCYHFLRRVVR